MKENNSLCQTRVKPVAKSYPHALLFKILGGRHALELAERREEGRLLEAALLAQGSERVAVILALGDEPLELVYAVAVDEVVVVFVEIKVEHLRQLAGRDVQAVGHLAHLQLGVGVHLVLLEQPLHAAHYALTLLFVYFHAPVLVRIAPVRLAGKAGIYPPGAILAAASPVAATPPTACCAAFKRVLRRLRYSLTASQAAGP